jgi:Flp pilus assembly protein TadB
MANTKRRRRSKHRGNAAGSIETRGRTGRKPTAGERRPATRPGARDARVSRLEQPPTLTGSAKRAGIMTAIFVVALVALFRQTVAASVALAGVMFLMYVPMTYYMDLLLYRRYQRRKKSD